MRQEGGRIAPRFVLYERAGRALSDFFAQWTGAFCRRCLEVTRRAHPGDPAADVELLEGRFPGCCQAGVADGHWIPGLGEEGRFPPEFVEGLEARRRRVCPVRPDPPAYRLRERATGRIVRGVGCAYLGPAGCRLGPWKAPLCFGFLCREPARALAEAVGMDPPPSDTDDAAGAREVFRAVVFGAPEEALARVEDLERRLHSWAAVLRERFGDGEGVYARWSGRR